MNIILGFDIGNTNTRMGIFTEKEISPRKIFAFRTKLITSAGKSAKLVKAYLNKYRKEISDDIKVTGFVYTSVVPGVNDYYNRAAKKYFNLDALPVGSGINLGIKINYDNPSELGADRITNAAAAQREYMGDKIIIDVGTAITFCVLLKDGVFDGGLITAGVGVAIDALAEKTSKLIKVDFADPGMVAARNPRDALMSGFFHGWLSLISGIINKIENEYNRDFLVILTGGYADKIGGSIGRKTIIDPLLTMKGLKYIFDMNLR
ncbi:MAG: type III pantothenate kinase [Spirochaetes bacterium]|jgi:type III pantothenate kinase|nr:type III pantothenate kinase [Spirochaetota bacterium]